MELLRLVLNDVNHWSFASTMIDLDVRLDRPEIELSKRKTLRNFRFFFTSSLNLRKIDLMAPDRKRFECQKLCWSIVWDPGKRRIKFDSILEKNTKILIDRRLSAKKNDENFCWNSKNRFRFFYLNDPSIFYKLNLESTFLEDFPISNTEEDEIFFEKGKKRIVSTNHRENV